MADDVRWSGYDGPDFQMLARIFAFTG